MSNDTNSICVAVVGHVDHGKSTVLGRLLADTDSLPEGKLQQVKDSCKNNSRPFEYAFLIDALKDEQAQGITIDAARVFFKTKERNYIVMDSPGHIEFLRNMVTGAARAEAAFLVIDALEGVRENSKRHGFLLSVLGIKQVVVLVNKMDLASYDKDRFDSIKREYEEFLKKINIEPKEFIPVSGMKGDNIVSLSENMSWHSGMTVLEAIDSFEEERPPQDSPFRMSVQDVYKFTKFDDNRRIVAGNVTSGTLKAGDEVVFYPSGKKSRVNTFEGFGENIPESAYPGRSVGFTLEEQIYIKRGEIAVKDEEPYPSVTTRLKVSIFWLSKHPLSYEKDYTFKLGTQDVTAQVEKIERVFDPSRMDVGSEGKQLERNMVAECILKLKNTVACDLISDFKETGRFVVVDDHNISGGGIVLEALTDKQSWIREKVFLRDAKWKKSKIPRELRVKKYNQVPVLIIVTGETGSGRQLIAKRLEEDLFSDGRIVYYLGMGSVLYGVDADIREEKDKREEHMRRLAEVAHIMIDSGSMLIVTAQNITEGDMATIGTSLGRENCRVIWVGSKITTDVDFDLRIISPEDIKGSVELIKKDLIETGFLRERQ